VIKPGFGLFHLPGLMALGAAVLSALAHLTVRRLGATETPQRVVFYFVVIVGVLAGGLSFTDLVLPSPREWLLLVGLAQCATCGQLLMTTAYSRDQAPVVAASSYTSVAFALILGLALWQEVPDALALLGALLIVGSGVFLALGRRGRGEGSPPPG
jgi:drug/metabolite transporter (DMT)-like permease